MPVDVLTEIEIACPIAAVAAYAADPSNVPSWYVNIQSVDWLLSREQYPLFRSNL